MTGYSLNIKGDFVRATRGEINASYKDLAEVCSTVRYMKVSRAIQELDALIAMQTPIRFYKYNKYMGARHELQGRKGAYPIKAAAEVKAAIQNAIANAQNRGILTPEDMVIIHAAANKTQTISRQPSKGSLGWGRGMYGRSAMMHSNIELAKVEIALATGSEDALSDTMRFSIKRKNVLRSGKRKRIALKSVPLKAQPQPQKAKGEAKKEEKKEEKKVEKPKQEVKQEVKVQTT